MYIIIYKLLNVIVFLASLFTIFYTLTIISGFTLLLAILLY
jgi:hypothetical protein